ncbi:MAG: hypothetical protein JSU61_00205 [Fidelibacterota bacterium]|nr:MAG: hypothetical protein JSU61_00205 [Candidatus Neomarinimicrobiota bacterium]
MKGQTYRGKRAGPQQWNRVARASCDSATILLPFKLFCLIWILTSDVFGAFEGTEFFRASLAGMDGICPAAMNNPALLPEYPIWASIGQGQPLGLSWASFRTASLGGQAGVWRGAAGVWTSGDKLYRETSLSAALSRPFRNQFWAGLSLTYQQVTIKNVKPRNGDVILDAAFSSPLNDHLRINLWYGGIPLHRDQAYTSLGRQLFHLAANARVGDSMHWAVAIEKTPPFPIRQSVEICLLTKTDMRFLIGYRTTPATPFLGLQLPVKRLSFSVRMHVHSIFGFATAFGLSYK